MALELLAVRNCVLGQAVEDSVQLMIVQRFGPVRFLVHLVQFHDGVVAEVQYAEHLFLVESSDCLGDVVVVQAAVACFLEVDFRGNG